MYEQQRKHQKLYYENLCMVCSFWNCFSLQGCVFVLCHCVVWTVFCDLFWFAVSLLVDRCWWPQWPLLTRSHLWRLGPWTCLVRWGGALLAMHLLLCIDQGISFLLWLLSFSTPSLALIESGLAGPRPAEFCHAWPKALMGASLGFIPVNGIGPWEGIDKHCGREYTLTDMWKLLAIWLLSCFWMAYSFCIVAHADCVSAVNLVLRMRNISCFVLLCCDAICACACTCLFHFVLLWVRLFPLVVLACSCLSRLCGWD